MVNYSFVKCLHTVLGSVLSTRDTNTNGTWYYSQRAYYPYKIEQGESSRDERKEEIF